jgi:hypothetical protein
MDQSGTADGNVLPRRAEFRAPRYVRSVFATLLLFVPVFLFKAAVDAAPFYLLVVPLAIPIALELVRGRLVVDLDQGTVQSVKAFRRRSVAIDDVEWIRAPGWGPVGLVLRSGLRGSSPWRGNVVVTALYSDNKHTATLHQLASMLDVPVVSPWSAVRWTPPGRSHEGIERTRPRRTE